LTALAIRVAAASAAAAVAASTVAESAMPSEKDRPLRPDVAMPRTGRSWCRVAKPDSFGDDAGPQLLARREMDRDVATVVDIGLVERATVHEGRQHFVSHRARNRCHRRDVDRTMRPHGLGHAPRHRALKRGIALADRPPQRRQFADQAGKDVAEALDGLGIGAFDLGGRAEGLDDEVDRALLQMQPAVGQARGDRAGHRSSLPRRTWPAWAMASSRVTVREL
jgi:hypothetical protein